MLLNGKNQTFLQADEAQKGTARRCIDNSVTGKNRCTGYCNYAGHPGFLTEALTALHDCKTKNCVYYAPRADRGVFSCPLPKPEAELLALAQKETVTQEGLRLLGCEYREGTYIISYTAVADYDLNALSKQLSAKTKLPLRFQKINCDFETARRLVFPSIKYQEENL